MYMGLKYNDLSSIINIKTYRTDTSSTVNVSPGDIVFVLYINISGNISDSGCILIFIVDSSIEAFFVGRVYNYGNIDTNTYIGPASNVTFPYGSVSYNNYTVTAPTSSSGYHYIFVYGIN